jgi:hypothetical protein
VTDRSVGPGDVEDRGGLSGEKARARHHGLDTQRAEHEVDPGVCPYGECKRRFEGKYPLNQWPSRRDGQAPSAGYAPSEYRLKPWTQVAQLEGWCPSYQGARDGLSFALDITVGVDTRKATGMLPVVTEDTPRSRCPTLAQCQPERVSLDVATSSGERERSFLDISFAGR